MIVMSFTPQVVNAQAISNIRAVAAPGTEDQAAEKQRRHDYFAKCIVEMDPDRQMIVQVFGEEVTQQIENAVMF